jgi:hypothetical protein
MSRAVTLVVLALSVAGCSGEGNPPAAAEPPVAAAPVAPLSPRAAPGGGMAPPSGALAPAVRFAMPERFRQETPSSSMRVAQAEIPGPDGPGTLAIFHFGVGGGGGREANLERWVSQVEVDPRRPPQRGKLAGAEGLEISWIEVAGTLLPTGMGGPATPQPKSLLFGAVIEGEGGPWFLKATGPEGTIAAARKELEALLVSFRPLPSGATA